MQGEEIFQTKEAWFSQTFPNPPPPQKKKKKRIIKKKPPPPPPPKKKKKKTRQNCVADPKIPMIFLF